MNCWYVDDLDNGLHCYLGQCSPTSNIAYYRHHPLCKPGTWRVLITGWWWGVPAVVDDFGNLVQVGV